MKSQPSDPEAVYPGQEVEVTDSSGRVWQGIVDVADEARGIIWIHDSLGERKLFELAEYEVVEIK